jgi:hypothetical protein
MAAVKNHLKKFKASGRNPEGDIGGRGMLDFQYRLKNVVADA